MGKVIGIISIKGGVGKTSVVVSLGSALVNEFGKKVLLIDANFSAPNLALHLGIVKPEISLHHVLSNKANIKEAIYETDYGFHLMPGALIHKKIDPFKLKEKINHLKDFYDVILVDSSPNLNEEMLATMIASDEIFVITTPDHVTLSTTLRAIKIAKQRNTKIDGLILNKVHNKKFELDLKEIEEATDTPIMAVLPYDLNVLEALANNTPSTSYKEKSDASIEYKKLAAALIGKKFKDTRFKTRMKNLFRKNPEKQEINRLVFYESQF